MNQSSKIGAVVIGRNEGPRLTKCIASLVRQLDHVVYVDSGSHDDSVANAQALGAEVVNLDVAQPFTAARARNAGLAQLTESTSCDLVQFIDGDCELREGWIAKAYAALHSDPDIAVVCGRRRERHPEHSLYNSLIDIEWDTPIGPAKACGGDALMRIDALTKAGGYNPDLIAGEEPELCVRLRQIGWKIMRIDAEMTWHDAQITRFGQWWSRARRAGHAYAEGAALHGCAPEYHNVPQTRRALIWGLGLPLLGIAGALLTPWAALILLAWPAQALRLARRGKGWAEAFFLTLGKTPEALGALSYYWRRITGGQRTLIEYK